MALLLIFAQQLLVITLAGGTAAKLDARMTCVSMGNPHAIFYCGDVEQVPLETIGPIIENQ